MQYQRLWKRWRWLCCTGSSKWLPPPTIRVPPTSGPRRLLKIPPTTKEVILKKIPNTTREKNILPRLKTSLKPASQKIYISCDCEFVNLSRLNGKPEKEMQKYILEKCHLHTFTLKKIWELIFFLLKNKRISQFTSLSVSSLFSQCFLVAAVWEIKSQLISYYVKLSNIYGGYYGGYQKYSNTTRAG